MAPAVAPRYASSIRRGHRSVEATIVSRAGATVSARSSRRCHIRLKFSGARPRSADSISRAGRPHSVHDSVKASTTSEPILQLARLHGGRRYR